MQTELQTLNLEKIEAQLHPRWMQALQGDNKRYAEVLQELTGYLRAYMKKRLYSRHQDIEDLVQETLFAIHQKRHTYQSDQPLTAWVYAIARYKLIDNLRGRVRHDNRHDDIDDWVEELWVDSETEAGDAQRDVHQMLGELPDKQRLAIEHTKLQGLSITETAALTGQSESAVKVNIHRGLKALASKFGISA